MIRADRGLALPSVPLRAIAVNASMRPLLPAFIDFPARAAAARRECSVASSRYISGTANSMPFAVQGHGTGRKRQEPESRKN
jgi:hypothetical protein